MGLAEGAAGNCSLFMDEDCAYTSEPSVVFDAVDAADCQDLLNLVGDNFADEYFVYDAVAQQCTFYEDASRECVSANGPKFPSVLEC